MRISDVILDENQFSSLFNYYDKELEPDEDTIKAVDDVLYGRKDLSNGALFFYNPDRSGRYISWFENKNFLFEKDGHRFFK